VNLGILSRLGFIQRRNKMIYEGPALDLLMEYRILESRIIDGALADVLSHRGRPDSTAPVDRSTMNADSNSGEAGQ
jgi:hypothetical protein